MLERPKGYKYWQHTPAGPKINEKAPNWAKEEFEEYQKQFEQSGTPDQNGLIRNI